MAETGLAPGRSAWTIRSTCVPSRAGAIVHLRVQIGKSRTTVAAELGWHLETYREWETRGHAPGKMAGPRDAWEPNPNQEGWGWRINTPFFTRPVVEPGARVDGAWQPPLYGPREYGKPGHEGIFEVSAERLHQELQRTQADWEISCAQSNRENSDLAADVAQAAEHARR